jgi:SAM-dependent methyltransferase
VIRRPNIVSEFSAQLRSHPPNPALNKAIAILTELTGSSDNLGRIADIGCGRLRHYGLLLKRAKTLFLVDTERQMAATHSDGMKQYTIPKIAELARKRGRRVYAFTFQEFEDSSAVVDVACCVAVFDVVLRETRQAITVLAANKLSAKGHLVVIIPRNDSTITRRCLAMNRYKDGHVFSHHGLQTFFRNFRHYQTVVRDCMKVGLSLVLDMSTYRQVCLIFGRSFI